MLKALPTLFLHLLGTTSSAPVEFYDKFQREADEHDRDFMKKYGEDLDTTLIFVGFLFFSTLSVMLIRILWGNRPVCSPQSHPLSSSMSRASSNRISPNPATSCLQLLPTSPLGTPHPTSISFCLSGLALILTSSMFKPYLIRVWPLPFSLRSSPCWASSGSTVTPRRRSVDQLLIVATTGSAR